MSGSVSFEGMSNSELGRVLTLLFYYTRSIKGELDREIKHERLGRKKSQRIQSAFFDRVSELEAEMDMVKRQNSTIFDRLARLESRK